jgi:hypothetical protein
LTLPGIPTTKKFYSDRGRNEMNETAMILDGDEVGVTIVAPCQHCGEDNEWHFRSSKAKAKQDNKIRPLPTRCRGNDEAAAYLTKVLSKIENHPIKKVASGDLSFYIRNGWLTPDEKGDNGKNIFLHTTLDEFAKRLAKV